MPKAMTRAMKHPHARNALHLLRDESMLHIEACVSNIYEMLGLPPCSFSKVADK